MANLKTLEQFELAPGLFIPRVLTGLWQIADMERDDQVLNLEDTAKALEPYAQAGFTQITESVKSLASAGRLDEAVDRVNRSLPLLEQVSMLMDQGAAANLVLNLLILHW